MTLRVGTLAGQSSLTAESFARRLPAPAHGPLLGSGQELVAPALRGIAGRTRSRSGGAAFASLRPGMKASRKEDWDWKQTTSVERWERVLAERQQKARVPRLLSALAVGVVVLLAQSFPGTLSPSIAAGKGVLFSAAATIAAATPADLVSARELALYSLALGITIIVTRTNSLPRRGDEESPLKALFSILRLIADALPISLLGWGLVALPEAGAVATSRLLVPYIITIFAQKLIERRAPSLLPSRVASLPFVAWRAYQAMRGVSIAQCIGVPFLAAAAANSLAAVALVDLGLRFAQLPSKLRSEMHHPAGVDNRQEMEGAGLFDGVGGGVLSRELLLEMKGLQTSPPNRESGRRAALRSIGRDDDQSNQRTLQMLEAYSRKRSPGQAGALSHKSTADTYLVPTPVARRDNQHGTDAPQGDCEGGIQPVEPHVIKRKTQGGYTLARSGEARDGYIVRNNPKPVQPSSGYVPKDASITDGQRAAPKKSRTRELGKTRLHPLWHKLSELPEGGGDRLKTIAEIREEVKRGKDVWR